MASRGVFRQGGSCSKKLLDPGGSEWIRVDPGDPGWILVDPGRICSIENNQNDNDKDGNED